MIICPLTSDECSKALAPRPQSCFLMTALPDNPSDKLSNIRKAIKNTCNSLSFQLITAEDISVSGDILCKICHTIRSTSFGISLYLKEFEISAVSNIFLETGLMLGFGKTVFLITEQGHKRPSDFSRTEWILFKSNHDLECKLSKNIKDLLRLPDFYVNILADLALEKKDYEKAAKYYIEAVLISKNKKAKSKLEDILRILKAKKEDTGLERRLSEDIDVFLRSLKI